MIAVSCWSWAQLLQPVRRRYTEALDLYAEIGLPCAEAVRERLAALGPDPDPGATPS